MIAGITASTRRGASDALLAPTNLVATLVEPPPPPLPTIIGEIFGGGTYIGDITVADGGANDGTYAVIMAGAAAGADRTWKSTEVESPVANSLDDGMANTLAVTNLDPMDYFAARHCLDYRGGGHADWYLPARNELDLVWRNRLALANADIAVRSTWTSTLYGTGNVAFKSPYHEAFTFNTPRTPRWAIPVRRIKRY